MAIYLPLRSGPSAAEKQALVAGLPSPCKTLSSIYEE
jgi:hypothetical protein